MPADPFHINPYDLLLLGAIFITLTFIVLIGLSKTTDRVANRFLAMTLGIFVFWLARLLDFSFPLPFPLALGPLLYFYVLKITCPEYTIRFRYDLLHFLPLLFMPVLSVSRGLEILTTLSVAIYGCISFQLIEKYYRRLKFTGGERYRNDLRWLHRQLLAFCILWLLCLSGRFLYDPLNLLLAVMTVWLSASAFSRLGVKNTDRETLVSHHPPTGELWQKGILLKKAMETDRYYQDPDISLSSLSEKMNINPHELSRIINIALKKNFNDFINEYRIRDVTRKMKTPANDRLTLLGIAFDAGFNSKTTFNRSFKQMMGMSPAEYKNDLKKDDHLII